MQLNARPGRANHCQTLRNIHLLHFVTDGCNRWLRIHGCERDSYNHMHDAVKLLVEPCWREPDPLRRGETRASTATLASNPRCAAVASATMLLPSTGEAAYHAAH